MSGTIRSAGRSACTTRAQTERLATDPRRRGRSDVGRDVRRDRDRVEPHGADDVRPARRRLPLERRVRQPAQLRQGDVGASSARRSRRRSARGAAPSSTPTGDSASTRTPASASCCRSIRSPATRRRVAAVRARATAPSSASARWRSAGCRRRRRCWYLDFDSELIYVGDSGSTEEGPASRRMGVEITNYIYPNPWTTHGPRPVVLARALPRRAGGRGLRARRAQPRDLRRASRVNPPAGVSRGPFGSLRLRHFGPRPLHRGQQRQVQGRRRSSTARSATSSPNGSACASKASTCSTPRCPTSTTSSSRGCATSPSRSRTSTSTPRFRVRRAWRCGCRSDSGASRTGVGRVISWGVARLFLAVWLAAFAVQTTDLLALVAPDECTEDVQGSAADPCPDGVRAVRVLRPSAGLRATGHHGPRRPTPQPRLSLLPPLDPFTAASPQGIFHVPKNS